LKTSEANKKYNVIRSLWENNNQSGFYLLKRRCNLDVRKISVIAHQRGCTCPPLESTVAPRYLQLILTVNAPLITKKHGIATKSLTVNFKPNVFIEKPRIS